MINNNKGNYHVLMNILLKKETNNGGYLSMIALFRAMLIEAINQDNKQLLIETCQYQKIFTDSLPKEKKPKSLSNMEFEAIYKYRNSQKSSSEYYGEIMVYILIKSILKATELSKYDYVGFLIKYLVTMYEGEKIKRIIIRLVKNNFVDIRFKNTNMTKMLLANFNLNKETIVYCLNKTILLIALQSRYVNKNDFKFPVNEYLKLLSHDMEFKRHDSLTWKYYYDKIMATKSSYGLLCLNDDEAEVKKVIYDSLEVCVFDGVQYYEYNSVQQTN